MKHLVTKAQKEHDADAFIELMERNRQSMLKIAMAYLSNEQDVADAMQESILTCYEKLHTLKQPQYFKTWLIRIVINECKDILRQNRELALPEEFALQGTVNSSYGDIEFMELLNSLEEKYRIVLILYYVEGFRTKEIADLLDMNEHTVKSRLVRAREKFAAQHQIKEGPIYG